MITLDEFFAQERHCDSPGCGDIEHAAPSRLVARCHPSGGIQFWASPGLRRLAIVCHECGKTVIEIECPLEGTGEYGPAHASSRDRLRLQLAAKALAAEPPTEDNLLAWTAYKEWLYEGMAALQSLDDLGEELNTKALNDFNELSTRFTVTVKKLEELGCKEP